MHTGGVYSKNPPGFRYDPPSPAKRFIPDVDGNWPAGVPGTPGASEYIRPQGYWINDSDWETKFRPDTSNDSILESPTNTDGFIDAQSGTVKTALPPNSRSFILGPLVDGYNYVHGYDDYTNIGYIQKDTRQFVLLARIDGHWNTNPITQAGVARTPRLWDGTSTQFTAYNQNFTLAMAQWFKDRLSANDFTKDFPYFYSGGVFQPPLDPQPPGSPGGMDGGNAAGTGGDGKGPGEGDGKDTVGTGGEPNTGEEIPQGDPEGGDAASQGYPWGSDPNDPPPTRPKRSDFPPGRNGEGAYRRARREYDKKRKKWEERQGPKPPAPKPTPKPESDYDRNRRNNRPKPDRKPDPKPDFKPDRKSDDGRKQPDYEKNREKIRAEAEKNRRQRQEERNNAKTNEDRDINNKKENLFDNMKDGIKDFVDDIKDKGKEFFDDLKDQGIDVTDPLGIRDLVDTLTDKLPGIEYSKDIADSIRDNKPKFTDQKDIPKEDIDKFINDLDKSKVKINTEEEPYADDNIITDKDGNVRPRNPWPTYPDGTEVTGEDLKKPEFNEQMKKWAEDNKNHPNNTNQPNKTDMPKWTLGLPNPLAAAGQSQNQVVFPEDGGEPYFKFEDHAYHNVESKDTGEVPDIGKKGLSWLVHKMANFKHNRNNDSPNTGDMSGYPKNIRGDSWKVIKIPLSEMPKDFQEWANKNNPRNKNESYIMESRKRILREITQPLKEIKELPKIQKLEKYRPNFAGKYKPQNTPNVTASKKSDEMVKAKNAAGQTWRTKDKYWGGYESQERMNVVYDNVGHGNEYFNRIVNENLSKKNIKNRQVQEHLNIIAHEKAMRQLDSSFISPFRNIEEQETLDASKDPLYKKVAKRLNKEIDYPNKPAKKGYPNEAPPKIDPNTGMHPKYGQRYKYDKLDPQSAEAMPVQGNPEIDANVQKALDKRAKDRKIKNLTVNTTNEKVDWRETLEKRTKDKSKKNFKQLQAEYSRWQSDEKLDEGMTTRMLTGILPSAGETHLASLPMGLTGDGTIAYGDLLSNTEEDPNTLTGDGEYTALTNMSGMFDAPDPLGVGQNVRHWSIADQEFTGTTNIGDGGGSLMGTIPGFQKDSNRNVSIRGTHTVKSVPEGGGYYPPSDGNVYLVFDGPGSPRFATLKPVDTTGIDTFEITASRRNNAVNSKEISGFVYDHRPMLYYWCGDHPDYKPTLLKRDFNGRTGLNATVYVSSNIAGTGNDGAVLRSNENDSARYRGPQQQRQGDGWRPIHMKPDGTLDNSVSPYIIDYERNVPSFNPGEAQVVRNPEPYSVPIPDYARGKNARYMIYQHATGTSYYNSFNLHSVQFKRRSAVRVPSISKALTDIEASPFVRVGPTKKNEGGKQRKKKVQDIIDNGLKYTQTKFSDDFPVRTRLE